jgi:hypothetical protein
MNARLQNALPKIAMGLPVCLALLGAARFGAQRFVHGETSDLATKAGVESLYVRRDTFAIRHLGDSLNIQARLTRIDTSLGQLVRACQHRRECP